MRGSPIKNFVCVLLLLAGMAVGIALTTHPAPHSEKTSLEEVPPPASTQKVLVKMLFSHKPNTVKLLEGGIEIHPKSPEISFTLDVPKNALTEIPLDITWAENDNARYFTKITIRQNHREDQVIYFSDQFHEFSDVFLINTQTPDESNHD